MEKSIRVRVLGREFALRVREEDEGFTRDIAAHLDGRLQAFKRAHPDQPELTAAVITALALAEELFTLEERQAEAEARVDAALAALDERLAEAMAEAPAPADETASETAEETADEAAEPPVLPSRAPKTEIPDEDLLD